ncbi:uncharacterized protein FRV6_05090 [Fusarium oxysporum]|uniref:Uncharacterized protein n=1 Tax=Fusarium oxysporum TaxID=5507 RepID=A0A2H3SWU6_FUSOX|nr:uncharacterized protein FRV6_05090 [Fusarium oxysporum]
MAPDGKVDAVKSTIEETTVNANAGIGIGDGLGLELGEMSW